MFNWNNYGERGKKSIYHIYSLAVETDYLQMLFFDFLKLKIKIASI